MTQVAQYKVIEYQIQHLGDQPSTIGGYNFTGDRYFALFDLPDNIDTSEKGVIQCRTKHNQTDTKIFLFNLNVMSNMLMTHPENKDDWMMDIGVVPGSWLNPGQNGIYIGYVSDPHDDC